MATVLIADNRAADRQLLRAELEDMGHAVIEASDAREALARARESRLDLILSDILMPGADGFELCRWFQQDTKLRHLPFAFVTAGYGTPEYHQFAVDVGAVRVLAKPLEPRELRVAVEELLSADLTLDATEKLRRLDESSFHVRRANAAVSQLEAKVVELEQLARCYRLLSKTNQAIVHIASREQLCPAICRIAVEEGAYASQPSF